MKRLDSRGVEVIGIAGASRTGKSTLTSYLKEYLQAKYTQEGQNDVETRVVVLHQDSYFRPQKPMFYLIPNQTPDGQIPGLTFNNWEVPEAIDFDAFVQGLDNARDNAAGLVAKCGGNAVVIVEGFLLLQDERITRQLTRTFFLAISRQLSMERRKTAVWTTPEPNPSEYFSYVVWPSYINSYSHIKNDRGWALLPNHFVVDASLPKSELLQQVIKCLEGGKIDASIAEELLQDSLSDLGRAPQIPPKIIFLIGPPGSGKGTLAKGLSLQFGLIPLSVGDLLREELEVNGPFKFEIEESIRSGQLIDGRISMALLRQRIAKFDSRLHQGFVIDGYPSSLDRKFLFETEVGPGDACIHLSCPLEVVQNRLLPRGRADDYSDLIATRYQTYEANMIPVRDLFRDEGKLIEVDGACQVETSLQLATAALWRHMRK